MSEGTKPLFHQLREEDFFFFFFSSMIEYIAFWSSDSFAGLRFFVQNITV